MGLFRISLVQFKQDCELLINTCQTPEELNALKGKLVSLVSQHRLVLDAEMFSKQVVRLVMMDNKARAIKLVNVIGDSDWSIFGALSLIVLRVTFKLSLLAGFVVFIVWLCGGLS